MDFEKICMMFTMQEPYYGILLSAMRRMPVKASECPTMGVARSGNVFKLGYNPDFVSKLDIDTILEICKHEILHVAFNQLTMWGDEEVSEEEHRLRNIAMDMEVNCYLDINKMKGVNPVLPEKFGFDRKLGAREYYRLLVQLAQKKREEIRKQKKKIKLKRFQCKVWRLRKKKKTIEEIAQQLNCSTEKVKRALNGARKQFKVHIV